MQEKFVEKIEEKKKKINFL